MSDFLNAKRQEISERLKELHPLVEEYKRLEAAADALDSALGGVVSVSAAVTRVRRPGRPARAAAQPSPAAPQTPAAEQPKAGTAPKTPAGSRRAGRQRRSGTRAAEALTYVSAQPGIAIPELATKMGIQQNYLYRVLPGLQTQGKVRKDGRGWYPTES